MKTGNIRSNSLYFPLVYIYSTICAIAEIAQLGHGSPIITRLELAPDFLLFLFIYLFNSLITQFLTPGDDKLINVVVYIATGKISYVKGDVCVSDGYLHENDHTARPNSL